MTVLQNKELIINLFNLDNELELEETLIKINHIHSVWNSERFTLTDLLDSWNEISNNNNITMIQLLDAFYKSSLEAKENNLSANELIELIVAMISATREGGLITGNTINSIISRISKENVINGLKTKGIEVKKEDTIINVFDKIKNHISKITNKEERDNEITSISKIVGGIYHMSRTNAIIQNM